MKPLDPTTKNLPTMGDRLRYCVSLVGSQRKLGGIIGIDPGSISQYVTNDCKPSVQTLAKISKLANVDIMWIITGEGTQEVAQKIEKTFDPACHPIQMKELKQISDLTIKLTKVRQKECPHLWVETFAPELFGKLLQQFADNAKKSKQYGENCNDRSVIEKVEDIHTAIASFFDELDEDGMDEILLEMGLDPATVVQESRETITKAIFEYKTKFRNNNGENHDQDNT